MDELSDGIVGLVACYLEGKANRDREYSKLIQYIKEQDLSERLSQAVDRLK